MTTVLLDVDGVLLDLVPATLQALVEKLPSPPNVPPGMFAAGVPALEEIYDYDFDALLKSRNPDMLAVKSLLWRSPDFWAGLPPKQGAQQAVEALRGLGWQVLALTAPYGDCRGWADARLDVLKQHFGFEKYDVIFCPGRHKHLVEGDVLVEDRADTLSQWQGSRHQHRLGYLMDQPWNRGRAVGTRLKGWEPAFLFHLGQDYFTALEAASHDR